MGKNKFKITKAQIGSIFIIVIMLASVLAVSFASWGNNDDEVVPPTEQVPEQIKAYYFSDVNGSIKQKTDDLVIIADTNELDITILDSKIKEIDNVRYIISSQYNTDSNKIAYIANLKLKEKDYNYGFVEEINSIFNSYTLYPSQIFSFSNPITLISKDTNETLDYDLRYNEIKIITESTTKEQDKITARFDILMVNNIPTQIFGYEIVNISSQPIIFSNVEEKEIFDLNEYVTLYSQDDFNISVLPEYFKDYNYEFVIGDTNYHQIITKEDVNKISEFIKDYNSFKGIRQGQIYVDKVSYDGKDYIYDNNVGVEVPFDVTPGITNVNVSGYLYKDQLLQVFAYK